MNYLYTIFDEDLEIIQTVLADTCEVNNTILVFITDEEPELIINLPPGWSVLREINE